MAVTFVENGIVRPHDLAQLGACWSQMRMFEYSYVMGVALTPGIIERLLDENYDVFWFALRATEWIMPQEVFRNFTLDLFDETTRTVVDEIYREPIHEEIAGLRALLRDGREHAHELAALKEVYRTNEYALPSVVKGTDIWMALAAFTDDVRTPQVTEAWSTGYELVCDLGNVHKRDHLKLWACEEAARILGIAEKVGVGERIARGEG